MENPDWTARLSADSALWSSIAAWLAAVATVAAAGLAIFAVKYAKQAAEQAGNQAKAALDAVTWSRKAAEAALAQTALLEKQMELSEPQPVRRNSVAGNH